MYSSRENAHTAVDRRQASPRSFCTPALHRKNTSATGSEVLRLTSVRWLIWVAIATACAKSDPPVTQPVVAGPYTATFDALASQIERDHDFAAGYTRAVGHPWRDDVPHLRDEFARATTREQALVALHHLQVSLHDGHCALDPPAGMKREMLALGLRLWTGGTATAPDVRVTSTVGVGEDVATGDSVVAVDGVPLATWLAARPFESFWLAPDRRLDETAQQIAFASLPWTSVRDGDARVITLRRGEHTHDVTLHFRSVEAIRAAVHAVDSPPCGANDYPGYALTRTTEHVCVYQPLQQTRPRIPIVHYLSFLYMSRDTQPDHDLLVRELRGSDGVILDLHDNPGGIDPYLFLAWFSRGPLDHGLVISNVDQKLSAETLRTMYNATEVEGYQQAQREQRKTFASYFACNTEPCTHVTTPAELLVTHAPVAVVTGPDCMSSCDTFVLEWSRFHLGPIVGRQPAHIYTVHRLAIPVVGPHQEDLGTLRIALSHGELEGTKIEGEPIRLDWTAPDVRDSRHVGRRSRD